MKHIKLFENFPQVTNNTKAFKIDPNTPSKIFGCFKNQKQWIDDKNNLYSGEFNFDYDEEDFEEFLPFYQKYGAAVPWFASGLQGKEFFERYKKKFGGPFKVRTLKSQTGK